MWSILRYLQTVVNSDPDSDIAYEYYRNTRTGTTATNLPSAVTTSGTGHRNRRIISGDSLNWRNHRLSITTKRWDGTLTFTHDWTFDNTTLCRFLVNVLMDADGDININDAQHLIGIYPGIG